MEPLVKKKSRKSKRDFEFYSANSPKFTFCGTEVEDVAKGAHDTFDAYVYWENTGIVSPCQDPELLRKIMICKKSVNFHIKMWVDAYEEVLTDVDEYMLGFVNPPKWVRKSFLGQLKQKHKPAMWEINMRILTAKVDIAC